MLDRQCNFSASSKTGFSRHHNDNDNDSVLYKSFFAPKTRAPERKNKQGESIDPTLLDKELLIANSGATLCS